MKTRYSLSQISLHWATLLMIILTYAAMLTRDYFPEDNQPLVKLLHFNFGICVWLLMFARIFLRTRHAAPAALATCRFACGSWHFVSAFSVVTGAGRADAGVWRARVVFTGLAGAAVCDA